MALGLSASTGSLPAAVSGVPENKCSRRAFLRLGRVEMWRGGAWLNLFSASFVWRCATGLASQERENCWSRDAQTGGPYVQTVEVRNAAKNGHLSSAGVTGLRWRFRSFLSQLAEKSDVGHLTGR
jgi:hypothetical protein